MPEAHPLRAGAAIKDITPAIGVPLAGSLTQRLSKDILDPLHARAVVIEGSGKRVAFVLLDLIAIGNDDAARLRMAVGKAAEMLADHVCVSCTHTHSGPEMLTCFQSQRQAEYFESTLLPRVAEVAKQAAEHLQPARVAWGVGREPRAAFNRRYHMRDGTLKTNPGILNPNIARPAGPTDPQVPMLLIESLGGQPLAVIANFSLHYIGDTGNGAMISADYYGQFADIIRARKGGSCVALLTHGASGDINNNDVTQKLPPPQPHEKSRLVAGWLADQVETVWVNAKFVSEAPVASTQTVYRERIRKLKGAELDEARKQSEDEKLPLIDRLYAKEQLELLKWPDTIPMPLQQVRVGDWAAATFPGEMFCRFGLDIKNASPFAVTAPIELANGYGGYIGTRVDYDLGGYETRLARTAFAAPFTGEEMVAASAMGLRKLFAA